VLLTSSCVLVISPCTTQSSAPASATILQLLLAQLSMLVSCLPSVRLILRPLLFTPIALLTLLVVLTIALVLSEGRSYLLPSSAACLSLGSGTGLALTVSRVTLVLVAPSLVLVQLLLLGLLVVLTRVLVCLDALLFVSLTSLRSVLLILVSRVRTLLLYCRCLQY
jgi:hypothetical protein